MRAIRKDLLDFKSYEFRIITNKEELWNKVADFAQNSKSGKELLLLLRMKI